MSPHAVRLQRDSGVGTPDKVFFLNVTAKAAEKSAAFFVRKMSHCLLNYSRFFGIIIIGLLSLKKELMRCQKLKQFMSCMRYVKI